MNERTFVLTEGMMEVTIKQFENTVNLLKVLIELSEGARVSAEAAIDFYEEALKRLKREANQ